MNPRVFAVILGLALAGVGCFQKTGKLADVAPREAMGLLRNDFAILIDLRGLSKGEAEEAPDPSVPIAAKRILEGDFESVRGTLPTGKQLLLCCESAGVMADVARKLTGSGYDVGRVGSLDDWRAAGLPTRR